MKTRFQVAVAILLLVLSCSLIYSFVQRRHDPHTRTVGEAYPTSPSTEPNDRRQRERPADLSETEEQGRIDFDWRQVLTNGSAPPNLPREEVEKYLERKGRGAESLLAAYRSLRDTNYLAEAAARFPNDPRVQLSVLRRNVPAEERRKWLDLFTASSPDNSLANYLSARAYFESGQSDLAVKELLESASKPAFRDYAMESKLDEEELNMAVGRSALQASLAASASWSLDASAELGSLKALAQDAAGLETKYLRVGDITSAQNVAHAALMLPNQLDSGDGGRALIYHLVGNSIESILLKPLDPSASCDFLGGKTPGDRLAELKQEKTSIDVLRQNANDAEDNMTEAELVSYLQRRKLYGDWEAMHWLQQRASAPSVPQR